MTFKKLKKFTITPFYISLRRMGTITPDGYVAECNIMPYIAGIDPAYGEMNEVRAEVIRRWESSGVLAGLEGRGEAVAKLFENQKSYLINEITEPEEFAPRRGIASRYADKMVDNRYYAKISVPLGVSSRGFGIQFKKLRKMPFGTKYVIGGVWNDEINSFDKVAFPIVRRVFR